MTGTFSSLILLTFLLFLSFQLQAANDEERYVVIVDIFKNVGEINQEITAIAEDDVKLQALLLVIRGSFIDYDVQEIGNAELKLLQSLKIRET